MVLWCRWILGILFTAMGIAGIISSSLSFDYNIAIVLQICICISMANLCLLYFTILCNDTAIVPIGWHENKTIRKCTDDEIKSQYFGTNDRLFVVDGQIVRECNICKILQPPRSRHCSVCGRCILFRDHHCPMLDKCIGWSNIGNYIRLIFWAIIESLLVLFCSLFIIFKTYDQVYTIYTILLIVISMLCFGSLLFLFIITMYVASCGETRVEYLVKSASQKALKNPYIPDDAVYKLLKENHCPYSKSVFENLKIFLGPFKYWLVPQPPRVKGGFFMDNPSTNYWPMRYDQVDRLISGDPDKHINAIVDDDGELVVFDP